MNIFESAKTWTKQGDIGEAKAILELAKMGYMVSKPLFDSAKYDLIIDDGTTLKKVQVKTTGIQHQNGNYRVELRTTGGNKSFYSYRKREDGDYDTLFVCTSNDECWYIPVEHLEGRTGITLGERYKEFKI